MNEISFLMMVASEAANHNVDIAMIRRSAAEHGFCAEAIEHIINCAIAIDTHQQ